MMQLLDILMVILGVCIILYVVNGVYFLIMIFRDEPNLKEAQPERTANATPREESILEAHLRKFREEDEEERRCRERDARLQRAMQQRLHQQIHEDAVRMHHEAHATAVQMHQQAHDDAARMQRDSFSMHNSGGFGF